MDSDKEAIEEGILQSKEKCSRKNSTASNHSKSSKGSKCSKGKKSRNNSKSDDEKQDKKSTKSDDEKPDKKSTKSDDEKQDKKSTKSDDEKHDQISTKSDDEKHKESQEKTPKTELKTKKTESKSSSKSGGFFNKLFSCGSRKSSRRKVTVNIEAAQAVFESNITESNGFIRGVFHHATDSTVYAKFPADFSPNSEEILKLGNNPETFTLAGEQFLKTFIDKDDIVIMTSEANPEVKMGIKSNPKLMLVATWRDESCLATFQHCFESILSGK